MSVHTVPTFKFSPPSRTAGALSVLPFGPPLEWCTTTWLRLNFVITLILTIIVIIADPSGGDTSLPLRLLLFPFLAVFLYFMLRVAIFVVAFIPIINIPAGFIRVFYYFLLSRLVVEKAPEVYLPAWYKLRG